MLEAKKSLAFEKIFAVYNRHLFKRRFNSLQVSGLNFLINRDKNIPLLIYPNHSSWWDGLVAFEISRRAKMDSFIMMEEKQLRKLFFFRGLGAFSVVREKPHEAMRSVKYAAEVLRQKPNRAVWIFPQGEILPNDVRPLEFYGGITKIIENVGNCYAVPLAFRYEFLGNFKPDIFVKIGEMEFFNSGEKLSLKYKKLDFEKKTTATLDELKADVITGNFKSFQNII